MAKFKIDNQIDHALCAKIMNEIGAYLVSDDEFDSPLKQLIDRSEWSKPFWRRDVESYQMINSLDDEMYKKICSFFVFYRIQVYLKLLQLIQDLPEEYTVSYKFEDQNYDLKEVYKKALEQKSKDQWVYDWVMKHSALIKEIPHVYSKLVK